MKILLVVTYLSFQGIPSVKSYPMTSFEECKKQGAVIVKNVKAGKVSINCWRI